MILLIPSRTWDVASATELSCFGLGSVEGQRQLDLAVQWRRAYMDAQDQVEQGQRVWISDGNDVIYQDDGSSSSSSKHQPAAYLLPHMCPLRIDRADISQIISTLLYHRQTSTVSFFAATNKFIRFLLVNHGKGNA